MMMEAEKGGTYVTIVTIQSAFWSSSHLIAKVERPQNKCLWHELGLGQ